MRLPEAVADDVASSSHDLQRALELFTAEYDAARMSPLFQIRGHGS